jgi:selT/selW/selH-like putative selenoprotein
LAAAIKQEFKCPVELVPGANGVFEVSAGGKTLFSKKKSVRFPTEDEIVESLKVLQRETD